MLHLAFGLLDNGLSVPKCEKNNWSVLLYTIGKVQCYLKCEKNSAERNCEVAEQSFPRRENLQYQTYRL